MRERNPQVSNYLKPITLHVPIRTLLTPFLILFCFTLSFAQPVNDDCNSAINVPTDGTCIDGNNTLATQDVGNGSCVNGGGAAPNIWFSFVAAGADYDISVPGLGGSAEITLIQFQGTPCDFGSAVEIDCGLDPIMGNNVLVAGQQYYVSITSSNGSEGPLSICVDNPADPPPPPNDDPCSPTPIPPDGTCVTGTTVNATQDWSNPSCSNLGENSVWYSVTLNPPNNSLDINISNQTITGDVSVMIGTFTPDCTGGFGFISQYCGPPMTTLTATGLTPGSTYWIVVSTLEAEAGLFDICATEMGPPPACAVNDLCGGAGDVSGAPIQQVCLQGCTTGVGPDNTGGAGCFDFSAIPTVWYTFTTDGATETVNLTVSSPDFDQPQMAIFEGNCAGYVPLDCNLGGGGQVALNGVDVTPNTTYVVAVGSSAGQEGDFTFCAFYIGAGGTNCITSGDVMVTNTSLGSPPSGPFQPGETVSFCFNINYTSSGNNCQWLHGVVPTFGDCWSDLSFDANGMPINTTAPLPNSQWYQDGDVVYNDLGGTGALPPGAPVGAGWFVVGVNNGGGLPGICGPNDWMTDPNCSFGIPQGCNTNASYSVCFDLTTKDFSECDGNTSAIDCGVSFKTYGDGETGGWGSPGCEADIPIFGNYSLNCCIGPEMLPLPIVACSNVQLDIFLDDFLLPPSMPGDVSYTWTVSAPAGVTGASACPGSCGVILSQILVNTTGAPQIVTYTITPRSLDGCLGLPVDLLVTVLPEIVPTITNPGGAICSGSCTDLFASATGGQPGYNYEWSTGDFGIATTVCPTFTTVYSLTVTDANGCTNETDITVEANPNLNVTVVANPNITELCESDPQFPIQLTAFADLGGPGWIYNWELANGGTPSIPIVQATTSGTYCVTLTDANGCEGEDCIDIIIHPAPTLILFPVGPLCQNGPPAALNVVTIPTGGSGAWSSIYLDGNGDFNPTTPGNHEVCYDFVDDNGCPAMECMFIQVDPVPAAPVFNTFEPTVCDNSTSITYCVDLDANATTYNWTFPAGVTITSGAGTECVTVDWNGAPAGDVCVVASNNCGDSPQTCQAVTVEAAPPAPNDLAGPLTPCENETGLIYTISAVTGATGYTWTVTGGTITNGAGSTSITVTWGTAPGTVCVTADGTCGSSAPACINIDPIAAPGTPLPINDPGAVCAGDNNVIYSIAAVAGASTYNWTVPTGATFVGNGTTSITVDWGTSTGGQICVNAENACGTSPDQCITVTPNTPPTLAGPVIGANSVCANTTGEAYSIGAAAGATGYTWTIVGGTQSGGGTTNSITVDWGGGPTGQVCVTADNACGSSPQICLNVTLNTAPVAPTVPLDGTICEGTNGDVYTIPAVPGATTYNWTVPAPATFIGQGTTSITIDWGATNTPATICVNAENTCGTSPDACFEITPTLIPEQPGPITGPVDPCSGSTNIIYSIATVSGATSYNWTVPAGATFVGQGTNSITVDWGLSSGGQICVNAQNSCGTSADQCVMINPFGPPSLAGPINGPDVLCANATGETYSIGAAGGATGYTWTITGGTQTGGGTTNSITVDWGAGPTGEVCVTADNTCGSSAPLCLTIDITQVPATPLQLQDDILCSGAMNVVYSVPPVPGATSYNWTFPPLATFTGAGTNTVNVNWNGAVSGQVCVNAQNACGTSPDACFDVTINSLPEIPTGLTGNDLLCQDTNGETYSINPVMGATSYVWTVGGSGMIDSGQGSTSIQVNWGNAGGDVCVYAVNDCGDGPEACLPVSIDLELPPPSISCGPTTTTSVIFNWSHPTATEYSYTYTVNGGPVQGPFTTMNTTITISPLSANDVVEITMIALGGTNVCGDSQEATQSCNANDCPLTPPVFTVIEPEYCVNETGIVFEATPTGGTFSGSGVAANGAFDPSGLPAGPVVITYEYLDANGCPQSTDTTTTIVAPIDPPVVTCDGGGTSTSVSFSWSHPTATMFEYYYSVNGGPLTATTSTNLNDLTINTLMEGDMVELFVIAIGGPPCGNSLPGSVICTVPTCPDTPPLVNGVAGPYCENDNSLIQFTGVPATGTFSGAGIDADGTFHPDMLPVGTAQITYSYVDNIGCTQSTTVDIEIEGILEPPVVSCGQSSQSSVTFIWSHTNPGVTDFVYSIGINGPPSSSPITTSDLSLEVTGLVANDIVSISIYAVGINSCGDSEAATIDCLADDCAGSPPTLPIDPMYCITDAPVQLMASAGSGTYSGPGVSSNGLFSPATAGVGPVSITYMYTDQFNCDYEVTVNTEVVDIIPAPQVDCQGSTTETVTFVVTSGATNFEYTYIVNGGPVQGPFTSSTPSIVISGLSVNDIVDITVIAIGGLPCGNSAPGTASCQAQDCTVNPPTILNVDPEYCSTEFGIVLMANPSGGTFSVDGTPIAGPFNPADFTPGPHTISYTYFDADGCAQTSSAATTLISPPQGPAVNCVTSTTNSVTFGWPAYPGATGYTYTYSVDGGPVQGPFTTTNTDVTIPGLTVNQTVTIFILATGLSPCLESQESQAQCIAQNCILVVDIDAAPDFCLDGSQTPFQLTVNVSGNNGTGSGFWSGSCLTGPNNDIFDASACATAGIQNVSYTYEEDGCIQTNSIQINVFDAPIAEAGPSIALTCADGDKELNGTGSTTGPGVSYSWSTGGIGTITNGTTLNPTVDAVGTYTLTVTSADGCTATDDVVVTLDGDLPEVVVGANPQLTCIDEMATLIASSTPSTGVTYLWTGPGINNSNENEENPVVTEGGDYTVIVTNDLTGCPSLPMTITVDDIREPIEVILTNPLDTIDCLSGALTFDLCNSPVGIDNSNYSYQWFYQGVPLPNGNTCVITVETPGGIFTYVVTDIITGCTLEGEVEALDLTAVPLADAGEDKTLDCTIEKVTLFGSNTETGPDITYLWTGPPGGIDGPNDGISVDVILPGVYTIDVTNNLIGCVNSSFATVIEEQNAPQADAGSDRELDCDFNPVDLNGSASSGLGALIYEWIDPSGTGVGQGSTISVDAAGIYALAIEDSFNGCVDTAYVEVRENDDTPEDAVVDLQNPSCFGDTDGYINLVSIVGGTPPYNYSFDGEPFSSTSFLTNLAPGTYNIAVEDAAGCDWETDIVIEAPAEIGFDLGADLELELGEDGIINSQISLNPDQIDSIYWNPFDVVECLTDDCRDVLLENLFQTITIRATVVDTNNCEAIDEIQVRVKKDREIYIPTGFSPNGDNINDLFIIHGGDGIQEVQFFRIYDRWGEVVHEVNQPFDPNDPDFGWDGTLKGEELNPAVFVYHAQVLFIDGYTVEYKGDVTLTK